MYVTYDDQAAGAKTIIGAGSIQNTELKTYIALPVLTKVSNDYRVYGNRFDDDGR